MLAIVLALFGHLPISFAEAVSAQLDQNSSRYLNQERLGLLPLVLETLGTLASADIRNGLLTGNSQMRSRHKRVGAGIDPDLIDWSVAFFGSRASKRSDIAISARQSLPETSLLIVDDTPFDGYAADAADIPFLAICTGKYRNSCQRYSRRTRRLKILNAITNGPLSKDRA